MIQIDNRRNFNIHGHATTKLPFNTINTILRALKLLLRLMFIGRSQTATTANLIVLQQRSPTTYFNLNATFYAVQRFAAPISAIALLTVLLTYQQRFTADPSRPAIYRYVFDQ